MFQIRQLAYKWIFPLEIKSEHTFYGSSPDQIKLQNFKTTLKLF